MLPCAARATMKITSSKFHVHFGEQMSNVEHVVTSPESINLGSMLTYILYCYHMLSHFGVPMWILSLLKLLGMAIEAPRWTGHLVSWYVRKPRFDVENGENGRRQEKGINSVNVEHDQLVAGDSW